MKEFWNSRYAAEEFAYGVNPNEYFKQVIDKIAIGKLLLPAEGEGRNAVYAAKLGWKVQALDMSENGKEKALKLAAENKVTIAYDVCNLLEYQYPDNEYDVVVLIFAHFPQQIRQTIHKKLMQSIKPGGLLIIEAFSKMQIDNESGGPKNLEMLYTLDEILKDFDGLEILEALETTILLNEGEFHKGKADVIRIKAQKSNM